MTMANIVDYVRQAHSAEMLYNNEVSKLESPDVNIPDMSHIETAFILIMRLC